MAKEEEVCEWKYGYEEKLSSCSSCSSSDVVEEEISPSASCCSTRKIVKIECKIVEKSIKKCKKTEQILKDCVGKPVELVKSTTEYTSKDVTNEKSRWFIPLLESELKTSVHEFNSFSFPGQRVRDDIETIEKNVFDGFNRFLEAVEEKASALDKEV